MKPNNISKPTLGNSFIRMLPLISNSVIVVVSVAIVITFAVVVSVVPAVVGAVLLVLLPGESATVVTTFVVVEVADIWLAVLVEAAAVWLAVVVVPAAVWLAEVVVAAADVWLEVVRDGVEDVDSPAAAVTVVVEVVLVACVVVAVVVTVVVVVVTTFGVNAQSPRCGRTCAVTVLKSLTQEAWATWAGLRRLSLPR